MVLLVFQFRLSAQIPTLPRNIEAPVSEVTVFLNQAQVVRSLKTWLSDGISVLRFEKISPFIVEQSLQVTADERIQILSVNKINNYLHDGEKPLEILQLEDTLQKVNLLLSKNFKSKNVLLFEKDVLLFNKQIGGAQTGLKADELEDVLAIFRKRMIDIENDLIVLGEEEKKLQKIKTQLQMQLNEYEQGIKSLSTAIEVTVKSSQYLSNAFFEIRYMVSQAQWMPYYDIRVFDAGLPVTFVLKAKVVQTTGENWKNIKLKLATSNPTISAVKPVIYPQYLRFVQPFRTEQIKANKNRMQNAVAEPMMIESAGDAAAPMFEATESFTNMEFSASNFHNIASGQQGAWVELMNINTKAVFRYAVVPKLDNKVFVTALIGETDKLNQIPAQADVYYQGTYTGKTYIAQTLNDTLEISLGSDKRIIVERKKSKEFSSTSLFGSSKILTNGFEITVRNNKKEPIELMIEDQIPVSTDKEIEVKLTSNPNNARIDQDGKLTWIIKLEPNKSETVSFGFEVKHPKNKMISGF